MKMIFSVPYFRWDRRNISSGREEFVLWENGLDYYCINPCHQFQQSAEPFLLNVFCCCLTVFLCNLISMDNLVEGSFHTLKTKPASVFPVIFNSGHELFTWDTVQFYLQFIKGHTGVHSWSVLNQVVSKPAFQLTYIGKSNEHLLGASFLFSLPSGEKFQLVFFWERE